MDFVALSPAVVVAVLFKLAISDGGRDPTSLAIAQVVVYLLLLVLIWTGRARLLSAVGKAMMGVLAVMALTSFTSVRPEASVRQILLWTMYLGIVVIVESTVTSSQAARRVADALVAIAGWLVLIALFMHWGADTPRMRWYSTFYWPNPFAGFLLLVLPLELVRYLRAETLRDSLAHGAMSVLLGVGFVLTYSRGAWLSLAAVSPLAVWLLRPLSWWKTFGRTVLLGAVVAAAVVGLTAGPSPRSAVSALAERATSTADLGDYSIQGRLHFWRAALDIFRDHPLLGTGPGTFGAVHAAYQSDARYYSKDAHNLYLQSAAEMGMLGLLSILALVVGVFVTWIASLTAARGSALYPVAAGLGVGLAAFFVHSALDMDWMFPAGPAVAWASVGILSALGAGGIVARSRRAGQGAVGPRLVAVVSLLLVTMVAQSFYVAHRKFVDGQAFARRHQWGRAAQAYLAAARWNPLNAGYHAAAAVALIQSDPVHPAPAENHLRRAMSLDPRNASHPLDLARFILQSPRAEDRYGEIEGLLQRSLALDPMNRPDAYRLLASVYLAQGRPEEAERTYRRAGEQYLGKGLSQGVLYMLLWPQAASLLQEWARWEARQGNGQAAETILLRLLQEDPAWAPAYLQLSQLYRRMGRREEAARVAEEGLTRAPSSEDLWVAWHAPQEGRARAYER
ncbi:MAG: O-antigen ligase family protein [Armatimonadota bacterium]|nr:O-antigen ligase family protein [Armatimonadota bacterium]